jgi:hypothetical protein
MRNTLWVFGDSMTFGHGCNNDCVSETRIEYLPYKKEGDDIWPNHLSKLLNYEVVNLGKNGASNDYIFDTILDNFNNIKEDDAVVINMTLHGRIEVPMGDDILNVLSSYENAIKIVGRDTDEDNLEKIETILNFQYYFSNHKFYKDRHKRRFNFIKKRLINDKKIRLFFMWSLEDDDRIYRTFQTIKDHTNGEINDTHFSFKGHLDFAHFLYSQINKTKLI